MNKLSYEEQANFIISLNGTCPLVACEECVFALINQSPYGCNSEKAVNASISYLKSIKKYTNEFGEVDNG